VARCPSCSRNAHDKNVLAWDKSASRRDRGWAGDMLRAVEGSLVHSLYEREVEIVEGPCWTRAVEDQSAPIPREISSKLGGSILGVNRSVAAEMRDDEFRVGDGVCREWGCVLTGDRGSQSLGRLADGKRERRVLLNLPEMGHRIPAPSWNREPRQPRFGGMGYGAASTDSCLPVIAFLPCGFGCGKFPFNERRWCHQKNSFRCAG
jgi:hypothetical protein